MMSRASLQAKLALLMTGVIAILTLAVFLYLNQRMGAEALRGAQDEGHRVAELASFGAGPALFFDDRRSALEALTPVCRSGGVVSVQLFDSSGRMFTHCEGAATAQAGVSISSVPVLNDGKVIGELRLSLSLARAWSQVTTSRRWLAGVSVMIFGVGMAAVLGITLLVTRPLRSITATAEAIRAGDLSRRATASSEDEVGRLARTFNLMLDELQGSRCQLELLNQELEQTVELRTRQVTLLLQSTYDGIAAADEDGRCVMMNRAAGQALGMSPADALGRDLHELVHGPCGPAPCSLLSLLHGGRRDQRKEDFR